MEVWQAVWALQGVVGVWQAVWILQGVVTGVANCLGTSLSILECYAHFHSRNLFL